MFSAPGGAPWVGKPGWACVDTPASTVLPLEGAGRGVGFERLARRGVHRSHQGRVCLERSHEHVTAHELPRHVCAHAA